MFDPRIRQLAHGLVTFSCDLKPGEKILIESIGGNDDLARALIKEVYAAGGVPFLWLSDKALERELLLGCTAEQLRLRAAWDARSWPKWTRTSACAAAATAASCPTCPPSA